MDISNLRKTIDKTVSEINASVTLAGQTNLAFLDIEVIFGKRTFKRNLYFITVLTAFSYVIWNALMVFGTCNTVQSHAFALSNLHGILIIPLMVVLRKEVHKFEKVGCIIIAVATFGLTIDNWSLRAD